VKKSSREEFAFIALTRSAKTNWIQKQTLSAIPKRFIIWKLKAGAGLIGIRMPGRGRSIARKPAQFRWHFYQDTRERNVEE